MSSYLALLFSKGCINACIFVCTSLHIGTHASAALTLVNLNLASATYLHTPLPLASVVSLPAASAILIVSKAPSTFLNTFTTPMARGWTIRIGGRLHHEGSDDIDDSLIACDPVRSW